MAVFLNQGKLAMLEALLLNNPTELIKIRLYKALGGGFTGDDPGVTGSNLTECDFPGYAPIGPGSFSGLTINGSNEGEMDSGLLTWTRTSTGTAQTVLGLFITIKIAGVDKPLFMHHFASSITLDTVGQTVEKYVNLFDDNLVP